MMAIKSKSFIFSVIALILSTLLVFTVAFAWFAFNSVYNDSILIYTGDIDLEVELYQGIDNDGDGILDTVDEDGIPLTEQYVLAEKDTPFTRGDTTYDYHSHDAITEGESIFYKIVITNPNTTPIDNGAKGAAKISMNFSDLQKYFDACVEKYKGNYNAAITEEYKLWTGLYTDRNDFVSAMQSNVARLMFKVNNTAATVYDNSNNIKRSTTTADMTGAWTFENSVLTIDGSAAGTPYTVIVNSTNYTFNIDTTLLPTSVNTYTVESTVGGVTRALVFNGDGSYYIAEESKYIARINGFTRGENVSGIPLWRLSKEESFIDNIVINAGERMEIYFCLTAMGTTELISGYSNYIEDIKLNKPSAWSAVGDDEIWQNALEAMKNTELSYFVTDDIGTSINLEFFIDRIYVKGQNWEGE